jgi:hypothetical protein
VPHLSFGDRWSSSYYKLNVMREKVVRLGRLERPTSCFGGTRSIQLSYSRALPLYHAFRLADIPLRKFVEGQFAS